MIYFKKIHPVTAWRIYTGISIQTLAQALAISDAELDKIEHSNLHLRSEWLDKFQQYFGVIRSAIAIKHCSFI